MGLVPVSAAISTSLNSTGLFCAEIRWFAAFVCQGAIVVRMVCMMMRCGPSRVRGRVRFAFFCGPYFSGYFLGGIRCRRETGVSLEGIEDPAEYRDHFVRVKPGTAGAGDFRLAASTLRFCFRVRGCLFCPIDFDSFTQ